ncbi:transcription-repair coupling factor [Streptomyces tanashiensis]
MRERAAALAEEHPELGELLNKIAEGIAVEGMESLAPVLVDDMELLLDVLPEGAMAVVCDPERVRTRAADLVATSQEFLQASWAATAGGGEAPIDVGAASLWGIADVRDRARELGMAWWSVSPFAADAADADGDTLTLGMRAPESYRGDTARALADTKGWLADGWRTVYVTEAHGPASRTVEVLGGEGIAARLDADLAEISPSVVHVSTGSIDYGFVDPALRLAVLTETDLSGQKAAGKDGQRMPAKRRKTIDPLTLEVGDYIVHEQHGVGRYVEMVQRTVQGATREYLLVEYAPAKRGQPGDRLYIPTDQLEQVTKYVGGEAPTLHRLGGADWTKTKQRAKKAVKEIAADLIKLYSARMAAPGHAFGPDTPWQRELEDAFPYAETPDELSTIAEVTWRTWRSRSPMDRLICGDAVTAQTEIAVRAAFRPCRLRQAVRGPGGDDAAVQRFGRGPTRSAQVACRDETVSQRDLDGLREGSVEQAPTVSGEFVRLDRREDGVRRGARAAVEAPVAPTVRRCGRSRSVAVIREMSGDPPPDERHRSSVAEEARIGGAVELLGRGRVSS